MNPFHSYNGKELKTLSLSFFDLIKKKTKKNIFFFLINCNFSNAEDFEYSDLLDKAAKCNDICEQLAYVTVFSSTTFSTCSERVAKPFNPLLGETFEFDRLEDMKWRMISEQVSHHPPILAQNVESKNGWKAYQQLLIETRFRGKHISAISNGYFRIDFENTGATYTFNRPNFDVYNIIFGKMYVDIVGEVHVIGHNAAKGYKATVNYVPQTFFSKQPQRIIRGKVQDVQNNVRLVINGHWNEFITTARVNAVYHENKTEKYDTEEPVEIWRKRLPPPESQYYYHFTTFTCQLNELEDGVAPTDSRLRPDQRLMEEGKWDESNHEKVRLEEIQRDRRKQGEDVVPLYFAKQPEEFSDTFVWKYVGGYWENKANQDWKKSPKLW